jgi:hypothetical protein
LKLDTQKNNSVEPHAAAASIAHHLWHFFASARASLCETDQSISLAIEQILFLYTIYNNTAAARRRFNLRARAFHFCDGCT